jgi:hypothetical protein
LNLQHLTQFP